VECDQVVSHVIDVELSNAMSVLEICFIGNGSHANRIKKIISNIGHNFKFIEHNRTLDLHLQTDVLNCDIIFITSPNDTHIDYIKLLSIIYDGYVYCEKPPINKVEDLEIFDLINPSKFFFGFNYRFSEIQKFIVQTKEKYDLGELININVHMSYPYSVKEHYKYSWKSDIEKSPFGVIENLGIHYLDLSVTLLGAVKKVFLNSTNINQTGTADDTASVSLLHENGSTSQIFISYATLAREDLYFSFERGDINYNGTELNAYYPREIFNQKGLFITPPIVLSKSIDSELFNSESLKNCVDYFINIVQTNDSFEQALFNNARISTLAMLGLVEEYEI
jgi:predicted dehydrogenase